MRSHDSSKFRILAVLVAACVVLILGYAWYSAPTVSNVALPEFAGSSLVAVDGSASSSPTMKGPGTAPILAAPLSIAAAPPPPIDAEWDASRTPPITPAPTIPLRPEETVPSPPKFLVRHTALDLSHGKLAVDSGTSGEGSRHATPLTCHRVHFAGNRGSCLDARPGTIGGFAAILFDAAFKPTARVSLAGFPSRTRVSPDGRYVAITVFVSGHSYAGADFSTETLIVDAITGAPVVPNLEQMETWAGETRITAVDVNYWGVTFASDSNRFYATLSFGGNRYLVEGDVAAKRMRVVTEGIECPSLSPDNTRIAGKKVVPGPGPMKWRLYVVDLATLEGRPVAEPRFIDEQVEWLDNQNVLYTQAAADAPSPAVTDVWTVPADGSGTPSVLLRSAASPTLLPRVNP